MKIIKHEEPGEFRTGSLIGVTKEEIDSVLGFTPNVHDDPEHVEHSWGFYGDGKLCAIWDYDGSHNQNCWSTFGDAKVFKELFADGWVRG